MSREFLHGCHATAAIMASSVAALRRVRGQPAFTTVLYRVSQQERARLREGVPYVKVYRYNPKHLYPKLNGYGDNGQRSLKL